MEFYKQFKPYSEAELQDIEKNIGISLPADYRKFLLTYGGGQTMNTVYEFKRPNGSQTSIVINVFYGNTNPGGTDLFGMYVLLNDRIPREFLPIGDTGGSDTVCIGIKKEFYGKIYMWWSYGEPQIGEKPGYDNIQCIADSFTEVINNLKPDED